MKLRNKQTGEIVKRYIIETATAIGVNLILQDNDTNKHYLYNSFAELCEEWEDYEEPKGTALYWMILSLENFIENEPDDKWIGLDDCKQMLEKLKAFKRLKDKGFKFAGWDMRNGNGGYEPLIGFVLNGVTDVLEKDEIAQEIAQDIDICFGGEE